MSKKILSLLLVLVSFVSFAQPAADSPQMADAFRQDGKIYVVITVIGIIFLSIILFLVYLERKVKKLEDKQNNRN